MQKRLIRKKLSIIDLEHDLFSYVVLFVAPVLPISISSLSKMDQLGHSWTSASRRLGGLNQLLLIFNLC